MTVTRPFSLYTCTLSAHVAVVHARLLLAHERSKLLYGPAENSSHMPSASVVSVVAPVTAEQRAAATSAVRAGPWAATSAAERAALLERAASLLEADAASFALAESADTGKPLALATTVDVPRAVANLRFFAGMVAHSGAGMARHGGGPCARHQSNPRPAWLRPRARPSACLLCLPPLPPLTPSSASLRV